MKLYIAITWKALNYGKHLARLFEAAGHTVTSHYLAPDFNPRVQIDDLAREHAERDIAEIEQADALLLVTGGAQDCRKGAPQGLDSTTGGRHVEFGYAAALKKLLIVLGPPENCFQTFGAVTFTEEPQEVIALLDQLDKLRAGNASRPWPAIIQSTIPVRGFLEAVEAETVRASGLHLPFRNAHEGYAVILEEVDELWQEVKKRQGTRNHAAMLTECLQIAAMATRFAVDLGLVRYALEKTRAKSLADSPEHGIYPEGADQ